MIYAARVLIRPFICFAFVLFSVDVKAQLSLVQNAINKIDSYKNFSYRSVNKTKELFTGDTTVEKLQATFAKALEDKNFGHFFNIEIINEQDKVAAIDRYSGQNLTHITPVDSTFQTENIHTFNFQGTLPGVLKWVLSRLEKRASTITKTRDTIIDAMDSYHLIADVYDTVINKERNYTNVDICIDKSSGLPDDIIIRSRNTTYGDGVSSYYSESRYFDYKFDRDDIDIAAMAIPDGFHPPRQQSALPNEPNVLLALGSVAPGWILYDAAGEQMSLAQLKGKVVLLDFFFIGCGGCMEALKPLNKLHEQYRNQNVAIVSMTFRDDRRSTAAFKKNYHIKYPIYIDAAGVVKSYHVSGFPTFYFIDKEGKVASVIVGYNDNFEKEVSSIMNNLIAK